MIKNDKLEKLLESYQGYLKPDDEINILLAICFLKLGNFDEAQKLFHVSLKNMFIPPKFWRDSGQMNWLVDTLILSGEEQYIPGVIRELELYKKDPILGIIVQPLYAYAIMEFLLPTGWDITVSIETLMKKPKWKLWYAIGQVLQSIVDRNSIEFSKNMLGLLKSHERIAKMGSLRETSEGLICMQGMSLAYVARHLNMEVTIENEYLPLSYLYFLDEKEF